MSMHVIDWISGSFLIEIGLHHIDEDSIDRVVARPNLDQLIYRTSV
jgi:hypothetical protein